MPASFELHVKITPDQPGGFQPTTFDHLLHQQLHLAGLDPRWSHVLIDARVAEDGNAALLHLFCEAPHHHRLDQALRIVNGTPAAKVRAVHAHTGEVLHEATLHAPLAKGQTIQIGDEFFQVSHEEWPHRNENGICEGKTDWQHAHMVPVEPEETGPVAANADDEGDPEAPLQPTEQRRGEHHSVHERQDPPPPPKLTPPTIETPPPAPIDEDPPATPEPAPEPAPVDDLPPPPDDPTPPEEPAAPPGVFPDEPDEPAGDAPERAKPRKRRSGS